MYSWAFEWNYGDLWIRVVSPKTSHGSKSSQIDPGKRIRDELAQETHRSAYEKADRTSPARAQLPSRDHSGSCDGAWRRSSTMSALRRGPNELGRPREVVSLCERNQARRDDIGGSRDRNCKGAARSGNPSATRSRTGNTAGERTKERGNIAGAAERTSRCRNPLHQLRRSETATRNSGFYSALLSRAFLDRPLRTDVALAATWRGSMTFTRIELREIERSPFAEK
jgi:hypothetical protein